MKDKNELLIKLFDVLINKAGALEIPAEIADDPTVQKLHAQLMGIREILFAFSQGDLSPEVTIRGFLAGSIKSLQAHLRHMVWQAKQVEQGDFSQRVEFLGEFSSAFNNMVMKLDHTLSDLRNKEVALTELANDLKHEIELRSTAMSALQKSEARFKYLANHDPLTGAFNRRSFMGQMESILEDITSQGEFCSIAMLDIDLFKLLNDNYGHIVGDEVLKKVVQLSAGVLRGNDIMGRYGGEEFIFLFYGADLRSSCMVAERIRKTIAQSQIIVRDNLITTSVSIGVCSITPELYSVKSSVLATAAINKADSALYEAKARGRNRVVGLSLLPSDVSFKK